MSNSKAIKTARVISEYYRVSGLRDQFGSPLAATKAAFELAVRENYRSLTVERVTCHEPVDDGVFGPITETVTGKVVIAGPVTVADSPELSRYHPVNGWELPESVEVQ